MFPLECEVRAERERVIVRVDGELDLAEVETLESTLSDLIDVGFRRLVVDVRGLSFMGCTGLRTLLSAEQALRDRDGGVTVVCEEGPVRRLLALTGTEDVFTLADARILR